MMQDFIELKKHYQRALNELPKGSFYHFSINHKFRHSVQVLHAGQEIMANSPELADISQEFKTDAERALLFHDIGRFHEMVCIYRDNIKNIIVGAGTNKYDHGFIGYDILKEIPQYNHLKLLLAVKYHGKMMEQVKTSDLWQEAEKSPDEMIIKKILYIVRDADKLANLRVIKSTGHLKEDLFYKQLSPDAKRAGITPEVMAQFENHQVIFFPTIRSYNDRVMMVLSWIFDFNFQYTRKLFLHAGLAYYLFNELLLTGISDDIILKLKRIMNNFNTSSNCAIQP
ncbi:MAG: HD domain-containing protein [Alphaproteobacteria bacterium]|nr:HD domain-containing protein [Alphaproteobacteria bacterium]